MKADILFSCLAWASMINLSIYILFAFSFFCCFFLFLRARSLPRVYLTI